jgi:hypothetical protein
MRTIFPIVWVLEAQLPGELTTSCHSLIPLAAGQVCKYQPRQNHPRGSANTSAGRIIREAAARVLEASAASTSLLSNVFLHGVIIIPTAHLNNGNWDLEI